jgi:hypothetical protein
MKAILKSPSKVPVQKWMTVAELLAQLKSYEKTRNLMVAVPATYIEARSVDDHDDQIELRASHVAGIYPVTAIVASSTADGRKVLVLSTTDDVDSLEGPIIETDATRASVLQNAKASPSTVG